MSLDRFMSIYEKHLYRTRSLAPQDYAWPESEFSAVLARMRVAIARGSMNKDSPAFKATCKELGISHTYKAIAAFIAAGK